MMINQPGGSVPFLLFCSKTAFFKLDSLFPECKLYREQMPRTDSLMCLGSSCPGNHNCMETLAKRIFVLFKEIIPQVKLIVLYFRKQGSTSIGAGLFWSDMREPRLITINPSAWEMIKYRGLLYEFTPSPQFFLTGNSAISAQPEDNTKKVSLDLT